MSSDDTRIRKAVIGDVRAIQALLKRYADQDLLLPRALSELYDHVRDYFVLERAQEIGPRAGEDPGEAQPILGVCGLHVCWEDLAEIKSLAVSESLRGRGLGFRLVEACLGEARSLGLKRVFVLTYIPAFFERCGFRLVDKSVLPHKIWTDCLKCPKFPHCGEQALVRDL